MHAEGQPSIFSPRPFDSDLKLFATAKIPGNGQAQSVHFQHREVVADTLLLIPPGGLPKATRGTQSSIASALFCARR